MRGHGPLRRRNPRSDRAHYGSGSTRGTAHGWRAGWRRSPCPGCPGRRRGMSSRALSMARRIARSLTAPDNRVAGTPCRHGLMTACACSYGNGRNSLSLSASHKTVSARRLRLSNALRRAPSSCLTCDVGCLSCCSRPSSRANPLKIRLSARSPSWGDTGGDSCPTSRGISS
jgi:hypothetical protein